MNGLFVFALVFCVGLVYDSCSMEESPTQNKVSPNLGLMNDLLLYLIVCACLWTAVTFPSFSLIAKR